MEITAKTFLRLVKAASHDVDWEQFGMTVAEINPDLFVAALDAMEDGGWKTKAQELAQLVLNGEATKAELVKFVRDSTTMPLRDARNWVDESFPLLKSSELEE